LIIHRVGELPCRLRWPPHLSDTGAVQPAHELAQPDGGGRDGEAVARGAGGVDDGDRVIGGGPVDAGGHYTGWDVGQDGRPHGHGVGVDHKFTWRAVSVVRHEPHLGA
jgi:hypothetical protein